MRALIAIALLAVSFQASAWKGIAGYTPPVTQHVTVNGSFTFGSHRVAQEYHMARIQSMPMYFAAQRECPVRFGRHCLTPVVKRAELDLRPNDRTTTVH